MSRAPIISGTRKLPRPARIGTTTRNTIVVPWTVKSWLYLVAGHEVLVRRRELRAHEQRQEPADDEEEQARDDVEDPDPLVVDGGQPRA